jgi:hypothetical protein
MLKLRNVKVENIMKLYEVFLYKACWIALNDSKLPLNGWNIA